MKHACETLDPDGDRMGSPDVDLPEDAATASQEIDRAESLRQWLLKSWPHPEIMVREVVTLGPDLPST